MRMSNMLLLPRSMALAAALLVMAGCASHQPMNYTIAEAVAAPDDTKVVVTGAIVQQVDEKHLLLRDSTGQITVEASHDLLGEVKFAPDAQLRVYGEIDRNSERSVLIAKTVSVVR